MSIPKDRLEEIRAAAGCELGGAEHMLGELLNELDRLRSARNHDPLCWSCFRARNEDEGLDPYAERDDSYVSSCSGCGHDHGD